jgi:saccharopine dehydrogenase-like NADP-dependent oxidoreductase
VGRVLVIGGYGAFGARAAERLARAPDIEVIVAGRSCDKAAAFADALSRTTRVPVASTRFDAATATAADIQATGATVLVNASGPFQKQDYTLARACIGAACHYVDLADARAFVGGIGALDTDARAANVAVISGASSVPGLSSAVVQTFAPEFRILETIVIGISPGNSFDPGAATTASILSQVGKPYRLRSDGAATTAYGWQGLSRHRFPELGARLTGNVEVPDLDLLPAHFPALRTAHFRAGLEVAPFHLGLWVLSWLVRAGVVRDPGALAGPLLGAKRRLRFLGSDRGGMFVTMAGCGNDGRPKMLAWHLVARSGHGPYVPATPAVILAKRLAAGTGPDAGAGPAFGLFSLDEFQAEVADLDITCTHEWRQQNVPRAIL